jgi:hypothetical protein
MTPRQHGRDAAPPVPLSGRRIVLPWDLSAWDPCVRVPAAGGFARMG